MLFYCNSEGKVILLLPVHAADWDAVEHGEINDRTSRSMCFVWSMIKELNLRPEDGDFIRVRGRPAFVSRFDIEEIAILQGFSIKCQDSVVLRCVLSSVPTEIQEAFSYED
jgi:hypothetical protein